MPMVEHHIARIITVSLPLTILKSAEAQYMATVENQAAKVVMV